MGAAANVRIAGICVVLTAALLLPAAASAAPKSPPKWRVDAGANSTAAAGSSARVSFGIDNIGDEPAEGNGADPIVMSLALPPALTLESIDFPGGPETLPWDSPLVGWDCTGDGPEPAPKVVGAHHVTCSKEARVDGHTGGLAFFGIPTFTVHVDPSAVGTLTGRFRVAGAGAGEASSAEFIDVAEEPTFGFHAFDMTIGDSSGHAFTAAAAHPHDLLTEVWYDTEHNERLPHTYGPAEQDSYPVETIKDSLIEFPPGLIGDPAPFSRCDGAQILSNSCPVSSQVGSIYLPLPLAGPFLAGPYPVFNMKPPNGTVARLAFNLFGVVTPFDTEVRSDSDYGLSLVSRNISEGLDFSGFKVITWGTPAEPAHDSERACVGHGPPEMVGGSYVTCESSEPEVAFLRVPTSCTDAGEGLMFGTAMDSWEHPATFLSDGRTPDLSDSRWAQSAVETHETPGLPLPEEDEGNREWGEPAGIEDCAEVPFEPSVSVSPTTNQADSPTGLDVDFEFPQDCWGEGQNEATCQADLRKATVVLPKGVMINPSAANGRQACTSQQVGLITSPGATPVHFDRAPVECPNASKVGSVEIQTPLISLHDSEGKPVRDSQGNLEPQTLEGSVYFAKQGDNPFQGIFALYLVVDDQTTGLVIKLAGKVTFDEQTGQVTTVFDESPQLPFSELHLKLFGGSRAVLRTPFSCGTYSAAASMEPWSDGPAVSASSPFQITQCGNGGFAPKLSAGTANPLAGASSPLTLRLSRDDGTQELGSLQATLPPGLLARLGRVTYCPESALTAISSQAGTGAGQVNSPSCPASSQVGTVVVGAGAGPSPVYSRTGRVYLAGPYKGAPFSLAVIVPVVVGPLDLGSIVVRNKIELDPITTAIKITSDPLPRILHGIPLDIRDLRVEVNRLDFTFNPTSCDPMQIGSIITSDTSATADPWVHFQVAGCDRLQFKPRFSLRLRGGTHRADYESLKVTATFPKGRENSNISRAEITLPHAVFLAQTHIRGVCTRVQFAADACPAGSIYGRAEMDTPLTDYPLRGPVYLRSSGNFLPDLVARLRGPGSQPIEIDLASRTNPVKRAVRNTFEVVPDAPVRKFSLELFGGSRGLIELSTDDYCAVRHRATVRLDAHSGAIYDTDPIVRNPMCAKRSKRHRRHHR